MLWWLYKRCKLLISGYRRWVALCMISRNCSIDEEFFEVKVSYAPHDSNEVAYELARFVSFCQDMMLCLALVISTRLYSFAGDQWFIWLTKLTKSCGSLDKIKQGDPASKVLTKTPKRRNLSVTTYPPSQNRSYSHFPKSQLFITLFNYI
jgi:hypothetical protein